MSEVEIGNGRRGVRFDPTINLGHVLTALAFLFSTVAAWYTLNAQVAQNAKEIEKTQRTIEAKADKESLGKAEVELTRQIVDVRRHVDATQVRTSEDIREMKNLIRDGFKDLDAKLDRKQDRPGR